MGKLSVNENTMRYWTPLVESLNQCSQQMTPFMWSYHNVKRINLTILQQINFFKPNVYHYKQEMPVFTFSAKFTFHWTLQTQSVTLLNMHKYIQAKFLKLDVMSLPVEHLFLANNHKTFVLCSIWNCSKTRTFCGY